MKNKNLIQRRQFLKLSSAAALVGLTGTLIDRQIEESLSIVEEAARKVGKLPRRKLGYSGREVSILLGAGDMEPLLIEAGVLCGINFWHKTNLWMKTGTPETIKQNREAHYCQVTVDRVGSDHYQGHLNEEEHYRYVKEAVKKTGLGYFDDMQLHFG